MCPNKNPTKAVLTSSILLKCAGLIHPWLTKWGRKTGISFLKSMVTIACKPAAVNKSVSAQIHLRDAAPSPLTTQPQAKDSDKAMELASKDLEEQRAMGQVAEVEGTEEQSYKPQPTYAYFRRRHTMVPETGALKELSVFDKLLEKTPPCPDTMDVHNYIERLCGPLICNLSQETTVVLNTDLDLTDVLNSIQTQGPLYETVGATMVVMIQQVFEHWQAVLCFWKTRVCRCHLAETVQQVQAHLPVQSACNLERVDFGEGAFERLFSAEELEDCYERIMQQATTTRLGWTILSSIVRTSEILTSTLAACKSYARFLRTPRPRLLKFTVRSGMPMVPQTRIVP
jgi:hypothetical protein